jgi:DNA-binding MarR family transcriptional regulator
MENKHSIAELIHRAQRHWPEIATPENDIALCLIRLHDLAMEQSALRLAPFELSQAAFEVLVTLRSLPHPRMLTPTELYHAVLITSGGMTKILKHLEIRGDIERLENEQDKRSKYVKLTAQGCELAEKAMQAVNEGDHLLLEKAFDTDELNQFRQLLLTAVHRLEST